MPPLEHFENDEQSLARLTALGLKHVDTDMRLMARVIARLLAERVCETTESQFRAEMAKGEHSSDIAGTFSRAVADEVLRQPERPTGG